MRLHLFLEVLSLLDGNGVIFTTTRHTIFTHKEVYDYENNSPRPTEPIRFFLNFLPLGRLLIFKK